MAFLPLVTCFTTAASLKPPSRNSSRAFGVGGGGAVWEEEIGRRVCRSSRETLIRGGARVHARACLSSVFSGMITFWPPAWHAAQFPEKILSPALGLPSAKAGTAPVVVASTPATIKGAAASATLDKVVLVAGAWKASWAVASASNVIELEICPAPGALAVIDDARFPKLAYFKTATPGEGI